MTLEEAEEQHITHVCARYNRGKYRIAVFIYFPTSRRSFFYADAFQYDPETGETTDVLPEPVTAETLFELKLSLTLEYLIPVQKLNWFVAHCEKVEGVV